MTRTMTEAEFMNEYSRLREMGCASVAGVALLAKRAGVEWLPERTRIKRGDVIESPEDAERYDVPTETAFRTPELESGGLATKGSGEIPIRLWDPAFFPLRCIDVPGDEADAEPVTEPVDDTADRLTAWHRVARHPAFRSCHGSGRSLVEGMLDRLTYLAETAETANEAKAEQKHEVAQCPALVPLDYGATVARCQQPLGHECDHGPLPKAEQKHETDVCEAWKVDGCPVWRWDCSCGSRGWGMASEDSADQSARAHRESSS